MKQACIFSANKWKIIFQFLESLSKYKKSRKTNQEGYNSNLLPRTIKHSWPDNNLMISGLCRNESSKAGSSRRSIAAIPQRLLRKIMDFALRNLRSVKLQLHFSSITKFRKMMTVWYVLVPFYCLLLNTCSSAALCLYNAASSQERCIRLWPPSEACMTSGAAGRMRLRP